MYDVNPLNGVGDMRQTHCTMNIGQRHRTLHGCFAVEQL